MSRLAHGVRQSRAAVSELLRGTDLGPGVSPDVRAKVIAARKEQLALILGRAKAGAAGLLATGVFLSTWLAEGDIAAPLLLGATAVAGLIYLLRSPIEVIAYPIVLLLTTVAGWFYAGPLVIIVLVAEVAILVLLLIIGVVAMSWRDGSMLDNLDLPGPPVRPSDPAGLVQHAIASGVLRAPEVRLAEVASTVELTSPVVALPEGGYSASVELPGSVTAKAAIDRMDEVAAYLAVPSGRLCIVQGEHESAIDLTVYDTNPYQRPEVRCPLAVTPEVTSVWDPIRVGTTLAGSPAHIELAYRGVLIGGQPRTGKTVVEMAIMAHVLLDPDCDIYVGDGKEVDTWPMKSVATEYVGADREDMVQMLSHLLDRIAETRQAARDCGYKRLTRDVCEAAGWRPAVLVIDELAFFTKAEGREGRAIADETTQLLSRIVEYGPAFGVWVVLCTQYPRTDVVDARIRQVPIRIALPTPDRIQSDLILGEGQAGLGYRSDRLPGGTVGVGVVRDRETCTVLLDYLDTEDDLDILVSVAARLREQSSAPAPGRPEIVDRCLAVLGDRSRISSAELVAQLGLSDAAELADLLRPHGVASRDIRTPEGTRRGYRSEDLEGATGGATGVRRGYDGGAMS